MAPGATYRLQFHGGFPLARATALVPYLHALGVHQVYASPLLAARAESPHGYDGVDPTRLNPALGTEGDLAALSAALRSRHMGLLLDIVPNHMAATWENPWWRDLLEHGPASVHEPFFDVTWEAEPTLADRLLVPVLGRPYGEALEAGELRLVREGDRLLLRYWDHRFPLDPATWVPVLASWREALAGQGHPVEGLDTLITRLQAMPSRSSRARTMRQRRRRLARAARRALAALCQGPQAARALDAVCASFNGQPGDPASFDALDALLLGQPYRLVFWRSGYQRINYRRFFQINDLVGLRVEDPRVFDAVHGRITRWVADGLVQGVRVDHVDGLYDPHATLQQLHARLAEAAGRDAFPLYVEKILVGRERLREDWPILGTTGYELLNAVNGLFIDPDGLAALDALYAELTGEPTAWDDLVWSQKRRVLRRFFMPELDNLERRLRRLAALDRHGRDLAPVALERALFEITACLPVYRTYLRGPHIDPEDREVIEAAADEALHRLGGAEPRAIQFIRRVLLREIPPGLSQADREAWLDFVHRWQQLTGPAMAKGVEDTAHYIYNRLISLNEVGGEPVGEADPVGALHRFLAERAERWPLALSATSTHDTKRSEDVRARIDVLSELPRAWGEGLQRWSALAAARAWVEPPDLYERSLLFQTLLGFWPLQPAEHQTLWPRLEAYLVKAAREAKVDTSWLQPNEEAERTLAAFAQAFLDDSAGGPPPDFFDLQAKVAFHGALNALAQVLLKIAAPGVPDLYQGCELWDLSLVDPDNRRPVDFALRQALLDRVLELPLDRVGELLATWRDGRVKLHLTARALRFRRDRAELFAQGAYLPLQPQGDRARHLFAFARHHRGRWALAVVPRLTTGLVQPEAFPLGPATWADDRLALPPGAPTTWRGVLQAGEARAEGGSVRGADLLGAFPVGLWEGEG